MPRSHPVLVLSFIRKLVQHPQPTSLETWLANAHGHYQTLAIQQAEAFAKEGRPHADETNLWPYVQAMHAQYNTLLIYSHHYLKSKTLLMKAKQHIHSLKQAAGPTSPQGQHHSDAFLQLGERLIYTQGIEHQIESMYGETFGLFIHHNVLSRKDSAMPKCFLQRQPPLDCLFNSNANNS